MHILDSYSIQVVAKYLNSNDDYINLIKCCKEYYYIIDNFKYNPIPILLSSKNIFKNIEEYHIYNENQVELSNIKIIDWTYKNYSDIKDRINKNIKYKNIILNKSILPIPKSIKIINDRCFENCELSEIDIPDSVSKIGKYCFCDCTNLSKVNIPDSIKKISKYCFYNCSNLRKIEIPLSVTKIGDKCFAKCPYLDVKYYK